MQLLFSVHSRRKRKKRQGMLITPEDHFHLSRRDSRQFQRRFIKTCILTFSLVIVLHALTLDTNLWIVEHMKGRGWRLKNYNLKDNKTIGQLKSINYNSFAPLQERNLECFSFHNYGHKASNCILMEISERPKDIREQKKLWKERTLKEECLIASRTQDKIDL